MIDIPSHNSILERVVAALRMKSEMEIDSKVEVLVDNMEDEFNKEFAAWPIRYFIAKDGKLLHKSDNSIENDIFDRNSIQNFFRGLGFVPERIQVPKARLWPWQNDKPYDYDPQPPPLRTKMAHVSSGILLMACCCSPCICILAPGFICVSKLRKIVKRD